MDGEGEVCERDALVQEAHGDVEGGAAPHLDGEGLVQRVRRVVRHVVHVDGAHPCSQQGLMRVAPGGVREQQALVRAHRLGELLGALLDQQRPPA